MKTIKQEAKEHANKVCQKEANFISLSEVKEYCEQDFKAGVEFAQRWIPVEEEFPLTYGHEQHGIQKSEYVIAKNLSSHYYIVRLYIDTIHEYEFIDIDGDCILGITHWRPIDLE